jgi:hypothetical protein
MANMRQIPLQMHAVIWFAAMFLLDQAVVPLCTTSASSGKYVTIIGGAKWEDGLWLPFCLMAVLWFVFALIAKVAWTFGCREEEKDGAKKDG